MKLCQKITGVWVFLKHSELRKAHAVEIANICTCLAQSNAVNQSKNSKNVTTVTTLTHTNTVQAEKILLKCTKHHQKMICIHHEHYSDVKRS